MAAIRLTELAQTTSNTRVDERSGRITAVKLIGSVSQNDRRYTPAALREAVRLYHMRPIYLGHRSNHTESRERDKIGWVENPRLSADGNAIYGDVRLLTKHPMVPPILQAAALNPRLFGMSHDAMGEADDSGKEIHRIRSVESVDVVDAPATTNGFFESQQRGRKPMSKRRRIRERDDFGPNAGVDDDRGTPGAAGGADPVADAVNLLQEALDAGDESRHAPGYLKALQKAIDLLTPFLGDEDDEEADTSAMESLLRGRTPANARSFMEALSREAAKQPQKWIRW